MNSANYLARSSFIEIHLQILMNWTSIDGSLVNTDSFRLVVLHLDELNKQHKIFLILKALGNRLIKLK
jgi:hypothetical protein